MSSLGSPNPLLFGGAAKGYEIERSLKLNPASGQDPYLTRTPSSASSRTTWTFSFWVKRSKFGSTQGIFGTNGSDNNTLTEFFFASGDNFCWGASSKDYYRTDRLFRDPCAWYHIVAVCDTTNGTQADRQPVYVNGVRETEFSTQNLTGDSTEFGINRDVAHKIGERPNGSDEFGGYLAEINFIDGIALDASSFGETNEDTGQWVPKKYTGSYGTNGFYLNFKDNSDTTAATLGKDSSGNGHNWTLNSVTTHDSIIDTPSNNFCTLNAQQNIHGVGISDGNLRTSTVHSTPTHRALFGTFGLITGKWYWEGRADAGSTTKWIYGLTDERNTHIRQVSGTNYALAVSSQTADYGDAVSIYKDDLYKNESTVTSSYFPDEIEDDDIVSIAFDADQGKVWFALNGTWINGSGTSSTTLDASNHCTTVTTGETYLPSFSGEAIKWNVNFGQDSSFAGLETAQGNKDGNGLGDFYYAVPSGFNAVCTSNLPEPTIVKPQDHFDVITYTGTATGTGTQTISGLNFSPGLVWIKDRDGTYSHMLVDSTRGAGNYLEPNSDNDESTDGSYGNVTSFTSDGFVTTRGSSNGGRVNENGNDYVAWCWNTPTAFSNDASETSVGTIDSEGYINQTAGISIQKWVAAVGGTFAHGLGVQGQILLQKNRDINLGWGFTYDIVDGSWDYMFLNTTDDKGDTSQYVTSTTSQNSNGSLQNGDDNIAYTFSEVAGFSKFGRYRGNGSDDGPFIYTGFRPAWIMYKRTDADGKPWYINDSTRSPHNVIHNTTIASDNDAEQTSSNNTIDFYSNGWKIRKGASSTLNTDGGSFLYMAFAEAPFKYSNAR